ncbi:hypothetical protein ACSVH2_00115 [Flavobacterium sp. RSB2_4_14]|uniref:hypothetical protein n=1 Tax=Flavobacterium sp. RSB2_4_14 TaxID=3447665 RepID=UPI003F3E5A92
MKSQFKKAALKMVFLLLFITNLNAQNGIANFEIKFYLDSNRITMESVNGNNWNTLAVKSNSFYLNQNGMVTIENNHEEYENSKYIIAITRKGKKITLVGKKGTKWKDLVFEIPDKETFVVVNQNGIKS